MVTQLFFHKNVCLKGVFTSQVLVDYRKDSLTTRTCVTFLNSSLLPTLLLTCMVIGGDGFNS